MRAARSEAFPGLGHVARPPLALEIIVSIVVVWIGLWTLLWASLPSAGVSTGSWIGFFGSPVAMAIFAAVAAPLGLFFCIVGVGSGARSRLRPVYAVRLVIAFVRYARSGWAA